MSVATLLLLAVVGLAFDLGRIYIARNEAQVFTDAASLAAAKSLDNPETQGQRLEAARAAVARMPNRWNLGTQSFKGVVVEFSADGLHWDKSPEDAAAVQFSRVSAPMNEVEITFLRAVGGPDFFTVPAHSVAETGPVRLVE
ncbi:MAG: pilus assembly protein TadG-related protein [Acidobacteriota bacterium]